MEGFYFASPLPPGNSSLASYFASKILAFKTPLPLGISNHLPWGGYGFFWNYTINKYTVITRVLVDPVYKLTPYFWGKKLNFLYFWVRVLLENNLLFLRIFIQVLWIYESNHSKIEHEVYYHA